MRSMIVGCVSLLAAHTVCARDSQKDLPLEKRSTELTTRVVADGEFLKSWKQGSMVKGITSFKLEGHFEVTDSGKLKFFDKWKKWGKQKFDAVFYGHAEADTTCVDSQQSSKLVRLWRTYGKVAMTRASGEATFIPNSRALKNLLNKFYAGKLDEYAADFSLAAKQFAKRLRLIRNVSGLTATTLAAIPEFPATKATAGVFAKVGAVTTGLSKGADYVADKVDEARPAIKSANVMYREQLKNSGLTEKDGGLVIDSDSKFLKNTPELQEFRKLKNLAMQVTEEMDSQSFYIVAGTAKKANVIWLSDEDVNDKVAELANIMQTDDVKAQQKLIRRFEKKHDKASIPSKARDLIERETFSLSVIYADEPRKVGEEWFILGNAFDAYLHPELKGSFKGRIWLKYVGDETVEINSAEVIYKYNNARRIELLNENSEHEKSSMKYI